MSGPKLVPEKITSPFQLMAAWFAMLVLLVTILLAAAVKITEPAWITAYLVIFVSTLIIVVVGCVLLMLTRFRPHLQDGEQYARWLKDTNSYAITEEKSETKQSRVEFAIAPKLPEHETATVHSERDRHLIYIIDAGGAESLKAVLERHGYSTKVYTPRKGGSLLPRTAYEAIWIGIHLPPSLAVNVIKLAVREWPHLKYFHLSGDGTTPPDDVHKQIFLGGATATAKKYGLKPWTTDEIASIDPLATTEEFHETIRSHYAYSDFGSF